MNQKIKLQLPFKTPKRTYTPREFNENFLTSPVEVVEAVVKNNVAALRLSDITLREHYDPRLMETTVSIELATALCDKLEIETDEYVSHEEAEINIYPIYPAWYEHITLRIIDYLISSDLYWGWIKDLIWFERKSQKSLYKHTEYHHFYGGFPVQQKESIRDRNNCRYFQRSR